MNEIFGVAWRRIVRQPRFSLAVIGVLAMGIAASTTIFSVLSAVLIRPLPYPNPGRLVTIGEYNPAGSAQNGLVSLPVLSAWQERQHSVAPTAYDVATRILNVADPIEVRIASVSGNFFSVIGVPVRLGRAVSGQDDAPGSTPVVVLSRRLWQERFKGDPGVIGRTATLGPTTFTIIGVAAPGFSYPDSTDMWTALSPGIDPTFRGIAGYKFLHVIGRLSERATLRAARRDLSALVRAVPGNEGWAARVVPLQQSLAATVAEPLVILMCAVALLLLIACVNVANLMVARRRARAKELAMLMALGAGRSRLIIEGLAETVLLSVAAGAIGCLSARWLIEALPHLPGFTLPRHAVLAIDYRVLTFVLGASLVCAVISGLIPAMVATPRNPAQALHGGSWVEWRGRELRAQLVVLEIALSVLLLVGAGLLFRTLLALNRVQPGFAVDRLVAVDVRPPYWKYPRWDAWQGFFSVLTERMRQLPGVTAVAAAKALPLDGSASGVDVIVQGRMSPNIAVRSVAVSPEYFAALDIPTVSGRLFRRSDTLAVAVVSERFARLFFPGETPIGKFVRPVLGGNTFREIIGVVQDVHETSLTSAPDPVLYTPMSAEAGGHMTLVVRSEHPAPWVASAARAAMRAVDPDLPLGGVTTLREYIERSTARPRFYSILIAAFATLALTLATLGINAVMAQIIVQRRAEVGIRLAFGATRQQAFYLLIRDVLRSTVMGICIGLAISVVAARLMTSILFGVTPTDAVTFAIVPALILCVAILTVSASALRAARTTPAEMLRG